MENWQLISRHNWRAAYRVGHSGTHLVHEDAIPLCFLGLSFAIGCYVLVLSLAVDVGCISDAIDDDVIEWQINLSILILSWLIIWRRFEFGDRPFVSLSRSNFAQNLTELSAGQYSLRPKIWSQSLRTFMSTNTRTKSSQNQNLTCIAHLMVWAGKFPFQRCPIVPNLETT